MFESTMLEENSTKSRLLTVAAMGGQLALVSLIVLVPLLSPAVIHSFNRQNNIPLVPLRPLAKVETATQQTSASSAAQSIMTFTQVVKRALVEPSAINPVKTFIDPFSNPPSITTTGSYSMTTGPAGPVGSPIGNIDGVAPPPPVVQKQAEQIHSGPVSIGGKVQEAKLIKRVIPTYPALAKQARVQGTVRLQGIIAKDGTIQQLQVMSGHPLLIPAAVDAVRQWVYAPTQLNGRAVEVICPIDVIFTLSQ